MRREDFYPIIDTEIEAVLKLPQYTSSDIFAQIVKGKNEPQLKSLGFLLWFLDKYTQNGYTMDCITEGAKDGGVDIIFNKIDSQKNRIFYLVQSKWNNQKNSANQLQKAEINNYISQLETLIRNGKANPNEGLKKQLESLKKHISENGEIRIIFLCLCKNEKSYQFKEEIASFEQRNPKTNFTIIDIDRLRLDYIEREYKQSVLLNNPLQKYYKPEDEIIKLKIESLGESHNFVKVSQPYPAYIFTVSAQQIYDWFDKYRFFLFHENVRNPLLNSHYNKDIERSALQEMDLFWYFNNGITAITDELPSELRNSDQPLTIKLKNLQIINGAQTVYSIYNAMANNPNKSKSIGKNLKIQVRVLAIGSNSTAEQIIRYNNSQNPIEDRDFWSYDAQQNRLQEEFYQLGFFYEKRRGEFRTLPRNTKSIDNVHAANAYLAFFLQKPYLVVQNYVNLNANISIKNNLFVSTKQGGFYETIFNENTKLEDILAAWCMYQLVYMTEFFLMNTHIAIWLGSFNILILASIKHFISYFMNTRTTRRKNERGETETVSDFVLRHFRTEQDLLLLVKFLVFTYSCLNQQISLLSDFKTEFMKEEIYLQFLSEYTKEFSNFQPNKFKSGEYEELFDSLAKNFKNNIKDFLLP